MTTCHDFTCGRHGAAGERLDESRHCRKCYGAARNADLARSIATQRGVPLSAVLLFPAAAQPTPPRAASTPLPTFPCVHRTDIGKSIGTATCAEGCGKGSAAKPIRPCAIHGRCVVAVTTLEGIQCCRDCNDRVEPTPLTSTPAPASAPASASTIIIDQGASGIGDGLLGLTAVAALREDNPDAEIVYNVGPSAIPFVRLFNGPSSVGRNAKLHTDQPTPGARQMNIGYHAVEWPESVNGQYGQCRILAPRWERYAKNVGATRSILPALRDPAAIDALTPPDLAGAVLLFPLSTDYFRQWPLFRWIQLERALIAAGWKTAVLADEERLAGFLGPVVIGTAPEHLTAGVKNAAFVVANDSGPAHIGGILGTPTLAVGGKADLTKIFGIYPSVEAIWGGDIGKVTTDQVFEAVESRLLKASAGGDLTLLDWRRLKTIRDAVIDTRGLRGSLAELGVYRGGVAKMMAAANPDAELVLFDTFAGIPEDDDAPAGHHKAGEFAAGVDEVEKTVGGGERVSFVIGKFPQSTKRVESEKWFRVVHVDGDTLQTTAAACEWFAPRMVRGGVMIFDDYDWPHTPGVKPTVDRFFGDRVQRTPNAFQAVVRF